MTEAELQAAIIDAAHYAGWVVHHCRAARVGTPGSERWVTPIAGDVGFPDLVLVHPSRGVLWIELKSARGKVSPAQQGWLDVLDAAGQSAGVWRPVDWTDGTVDRNLGLDRT